MSVLTQDERKRVTRYLAETYAEVMQMVQNLSGGQLDFKPGPDRWSIAETIEHLSILDTLTLNLIQQAIGSLSAMKESAWKGRDDALLAQVRYRTPPLKGPQIICPSGELEHHQLFHRFETARDCLNRFAAMTEAALREHCIAHPVYGELDCYQWLLVMGAHCERHLAQICEVMDSADFPKFVPTDKSALNTARRSMN